MDRYNRYNRYKLITYIVFMFVYLLARFPLPTILVTFMLVIACWILRGSPASITEQISKRRLREDALRSASIYLAPYNNIWNNLKLSNKYCSLRLGSYGGSITARDTVNPKKSYKIVSSKIHSYDSLWNMFCLNFTYNTTFEELVELAHRFGAIVELSETQTPVSTGLQTNTQNNDNSISVDLPKETVKKELLDVNNASEVELTALPGVSIVLAKKIIKKRDDIGGFKDVRDFLLFTKLKPHMQNQLKEMVCVKKMKGSLNIKRYEERKLDL